ncbi:hypothetical protein CcaCcLH18_07057 [Colletotrichum camelliae]|nr:hypothetical protein CcaCcLH18_07057 [Colletotrichum camelliae]
MAVSSPPRLAAEIGSIMPETYQDENLVRAQLLLGDTTDQCSHEYLKMGLYKLSNNFPGHNQITFDELNQISQLIEDSGITKMPLQLEQIEDVTTVATVENLFQNSIKQSSCYESDEDLVHSATWRVVDWLLASGQDPNAPISVYGGQMTPLQVACFSEGCISSLVLRLMEAGADPNLTYSEPSTPLWLLISKYDKWNIDGTGLHLIQSLLLGGASMDQSPHWPVLIQAINKETPDWKLIGTLIENGANVLRQVMNTERRWLFRTYSVLLHAAKLPEETTATEVFLYLLWHAQSLEPTTPLAGFITRNDVLFAAMWGCNSILNELYTFGIDPTLPGDEGYSALHVAAYFGQLETCKWLLEHGAQVDGPPHLEDLPSPLFLAASTGQYRIVELLHQHGADIHFCISAHFTDPLGGDSTDSVDKCVVSTLAAAFSEHYHVRDGPLRFRTARTYGMRNHLENNLRVVQYLPDAGADPNWIGPNGVTALQLALSPATQGSRPTNVALATSLLNAGSNLVGGEAQNAVLLGDSDLLESILKNDPSDMWQPEALASILETAFCSGTQRIVDIVLQKSPGAYSPGALCANITFERAYPQSMSVRRMLHNRHYSDSASPLEGLAISLAAWYDMTETLDLLLKTFLRPISAVLPAKLRYRGSVPGSDEYAKHMRKDVEGYLQLDTANGRPFWHESTTLGSPLALALWSERSLSRLLDHGYRPDRLTMSLAAASGDVSTFKKLLSYPRLDSDFDNARTHGPLSILVAKGDITSVQSFLDKGGEVDEDNLVVRFGRSPLQRAVENGNLALVDLLIHAGANVNTPAADADGATALQLAAITGRLGTAKALVSLGADINAPGAKEGGRTALEGAAEHGRIDMIQYLLIEGAQTTGKGYMQYFRAIKFAQVEGHNAAANLLKEFREWTLKDRKLWMLVEPMSKEECEDLSEGVFKRWSSSLE